MTARKHGTRRPLRGKRPAASASKRSRRHTTDSGGDPRRGVIGLALSGGGARGLAHIGVLKVLEREHIGVQCLSGASMGGIIAAATATGISATQLEEVALEMSSLRRLVRLVDWHPPARGLLAGHKLRSFLATLFPPDLTFNDLRVPLALEAVDLDTGEEVALAEGSVLDAVMATAAFPGVLPPVGWQGRRLVDGGVLDNLPMDLLRSLGADTVIAVNVGPMPGEAEEAESSQVPGHWPTFIQTAIAAIAIMTRAQTRAKLQAEEPDLLIHPHLPTNVGTFSSFTRAREIIEIGEQAAIDAMSAPGWRLLRARIPSPAESACQTMA